jgi:dTDP-4-dehydrorhamnose reductase
MTGFRILLFGKSGQIGTALQAGLIKCGTVYAPGRTVCDLGDPEQLRSAVRSFRPNLIVNAAAYTNVDKAEADPDLCYRINAEAPGVLAKEADAIGAWLIHYSTDYVFDGRKTSSYVENDVPSPINVYGLSKYAGECSIAANARNHTILRVSWIFSPTGHNFAKTVLRLASQREELKVVCDQIGAPTSADFVAEVTLKIASKIAAAPSEEVSEFRGLFNVAPSGSVSWHQFAVELVREARRQGWPLRLWEDGISRITTDQYPSSAKRPKNSVLDTEKIRRLLGIGAPPWQAQLRDFVSRLHEV